MAQREQWSSQLGFCMACIGSAVGLGNIWRFPYIVGENGGGAFLIPYVIITITFGFVFMVIEFAVGRYYQTSIISGFAKIRTNFKWFGIIITCVAFGGLSYYLVIVGWVFAFFVLFTLDIKLSFEEFTNSWYPIASFFLVLAIMFVISKRGISSGIEKINKIGILLLIMFLVPLTIYSIFLPGSEEGILYYLTPNYEMLLEPSIWSIAFGQVFFSLSIGTAILLTYSSYMREKTSLVKSSIIIIIANASVSFVAGIMIFSIIFSYGKEPDAGIALVFNMLPLIFEDMVFGNIIGAGFFFLLLVAGLTSAVSIFQVPVSGLADYKKISIAKSSTIIAVLVGISGSIVALSYSTANLQLYGIPILDLMDSFFGTYGITVSSVIFIIVVTWFMDKKKLVQEINMNSRIKFTVNSINVIKFVLPTVLIGSLVLSFLVQ